MLDDDFLFMNYLRSIARFCSNKMNYLRSLFNAQPVRHRFYTQCRYETELTRIISLTSVKNVPVILNFSIGNYCNTCTETSPVIEKLIEDLEERLDYAEVKADEMEFRDWLLRYGVKHFPTLVAIRREFQEDSLPMRPDMRKTSTFRSDTDDST
jgi:thiol-disulfide isomerase/thioredoxin